MQLLITQQIQRVNPLRTGRGPPACMRDGHVSISVCSGAAFLHFVVDFVW